MKTKPIQIVQLNTNCSNTVCHTMLNTFIDKFDIILVTEPWWGSIGNDQKGPASLGAWTPIPPMARIPEDRRPRVMTYVKKRQDFQVTLRSDLAKDLDIQILDITQANYPTVTIVNVYNQPRNRNTQITEADASERLRAISLPEERPVILSGDWNQHHPAWSKGEPQPTERTEELIEWMQSGDFTLLNEKGACTYHEHRRKRATSVLDLTWVNAEARALDAVREWAIDPSLACGSDHFALRWIIEHGATEVQNITGSRYSFKETKPKEWQEAF